MRPQIKKKHSTKAERVLIERLKLLHIPFQHRLKIKNREIDFVFPERRIVIEIENHLQDFKKNKMLVSEGYTPIHITNKQVYSPKLIQWLEQIFSIPPTKR